MNNLSAGSQPVKTFDELVATDVRLKPISEVASNLKLLSEEVLPFGSHVAKIDPIKCLDRLRGETLGRYIVITAITPTTSGEGKTYNTISACEGINALIRQEKKSTLQRNIAAACIRQPSLGPTFGSKGGAAGGGRAQVLPMHAINLGLTHDELVINTAHNMITAALLTEVRVGDLDFDPNSLDFPSVIPLGDKSLQNITRHIVRTKGRGPLDINLGFQISTASELMAIVALAQDAQDLLERIERIVVARDKNGAAITAKNLQVAEAATAFLWSNNVMFPNLLQTVAGNPAFIHAGPFANIAHGNSSIIADQVALRLTDYAVTEAGFDSSMGFEKFINIKCRTSGLFPNAAGLVVTLKAMKSHCKNENDWSAGLENIRFHINNVQRYGIPCVVILNPFAAIDKPEEILELKRQLLTMGAHSIVINRAYNEGKNGALELAEGLMSAADKNAQPKPTFLYENHLPLEEKISALVKSYGGKGAQYSPQAKEKLAAIKKMGVANLPICMAKTQYSLSDNPDLKGAPKDFEVLIRDLAVCAGAGFIRVIAGEMNLLPGWGSKANYQKIRFNPKTLEITGVS